MKLKTLALTLLTLSLAGATLARADVTNPVVKERVDLMGTIRTSFAALGGMVQGRADFDADVAAEARDTLVEAAGLIPAKFEAAETDPESEASPAIWESWDDFASHASALEEAALALDTTSLDTMKAGFGPIGASCGSCHQAYRVK